MPTDLKTIAQSDFPEIIANNQTTCSFVTSSGSVVSSVGTVSTITDMAVLIDLGVSEDYEFSVFCGTEFAPLKLRGKMNVDGTDYRILRTVPLESGAGFQFHLGTVK